MANFQKETKRTPKKTKTKNKKTKNITDLLNSVGRRGWGEGCGGRGEQVLRGEHECDKMTRTKPHLETSARAEHTHWAQADTWQGCVSRAREAHALVCRLRVTFTYLASTQQSDYPSLRQQATLHVQRVSKAQLSCRRLGGSAKQTAGTNLSARSKRKRSQAYYFRHTRLMRIVSTARAARGPSQGAIYELKSSYFRCLEAIVLHHFVATHTLWTLKTVTTIMYSLHLIVETGINFRRSME